MVTTVKKILQNIQVYFSGKLSIKKFMPGIAWFFVVLFLICLPGSDLPTSTDWLNKIYFDKWVHAGMFGLLTFFFISPIKESVLPSISKKLYVTLIVLVVIAWGLTTEFIQKYYIPGRSFDPLDWMADSFGSLISVWAYRYIFPLRKT